MKIIDILEGFNKFFEKTYPNRGYFIHKLSIEQSKVSKIYKTYKLEIWNITNGNKRYVFTIQETGRFTESMEDEIVKLLNIKLIEGLFEHYNDILNGIQ